MMARALWHSSCMALLYFMKDWIVFWLVLVLKAPMAALEL